MKRSIEVLLCISNINSDQEMEEELAEDEVAGRGQLVNRGLPIFGADQYKCMRCGRPDLSIVDDRLQITVTFRQQKLFEWTD